MGSGTVPEDDASYDIRWQPRPFCRLLAIHNFGPYLNLPRAPPTPWLPRMCRAMPPWIHVSGRDWAVSGAPAGSHELYPLRRAGVAVERGKRVGITVYEAKRRPAWTPGTSHRAPPAPGVLNPTYNQIPTHLP